MPQNWRKKREIRLKQWLEAEGISFKSKKAEKVYKERVTRFIKAIHHEIPDRTPVVLPLGVSYPAYHCNKTLKDIMEDYDLLKYCWIKTIKELDPDVFQPPVLVFPAKILAQLDYQQWVWPGRGLPENAETYQYVEREYVSADELKKLIYDPTFFVLSKLLSRTCGALRDLSILTPFRLFLHIPLNSISIFCDQRIKKVMKLLLKISKEWALWQRVVSEVTKELISVGYPQLWGSFASAPFDLLADTLRGTKGIFVDMYRHPKKLKDALNWATKVAIETALHTARLGGAPVIFIPLHKGSDAFMSQRQFCEFYWPGLRKLIITLVNEGYIPWLFAEGTYNSRLEVIKKLPAKSVVWHFENTDMLMAKRFLKDVACIAGNVSPLLIQSGDPDEIISTCEELIKTAGKVVLS